MMIDGKPVEVLETPYREVAYLRAENEKLTEELTEQARLLGISAEKELALMAKMDQLKKELATAQEHIRDLEAVRQNDIDEFNILSEQLAAALVACAAKDALFDGFRDNILFRMGVDSPYRKELIAPFWERAKEAIVIKPDASALKAHDDALIERCAVVCEQYDEHIEAKRDAKYQAEYAGRQAGAMRCAAAIRELKGKL